ncbi:MAG: hypothetical protein ACP5HS_02620 [Anaerolineae bacterium]
MTAVTAPNEAQVLFASANASAHFALACLEPAAHGLRATSTFVDLDGTVMHWHDFGDLEGPGWAANAMGGAHLLYRWGCYVQDSSIMDRALQLANHVLLDGFIREDGAIWPYWDLAAGHFCLNYAHTNDWLCPGSLAKVGVQMLDLADSLERDSPDEAGVAHPALVTRLRETAEGLADWLADRVAALPNGWVPRRITEEGEPYAFTPEGDDDPVFDHSADGLYLLALWIRLGREALAVPLGDAFVNAGGFWGSLNHDTYDDYENVAYAVAFRVLREGAAAFFRPAWRDFAYEVALPAMDAFRMDENRHGVVTQGLFWMERSWDTAYLWENAEVAQAYLEAWQERDDEDYLDTALATLTAIAHHHTGELGFLTEGIDWNNHVSQRHHVNLAYYGAIRYTEPLLNNLQVVGPTLTILQSLGVAPPADISLPASLTSLADLTPVSAGAEALQSEGMRYLLRLYHPAIATDEGVEAALDFAQEAGIDGVLLFEASFDTDPALLTLDVLERRFARLKDIVPRFRDAGLQVHINVMITMGHSDAGGGQPEAFDFQFLVDAEGHVSRCTACPLDPKFLDYVEQIYTWAGECGADAVWVDDDVRFLWHDVPAMTCFCPLHLAEMENRTGQAWTREALAAALAEDTGDTSLRRAWLDLQASAMVDLTARIEGAVHGTDKADDSTSGQAMGLMSVGTSVHNAEGRRTDQLLRVLSGADQRLMLRPGSGFWHDWEPGNVLVKTEDVARQVAYLGEDVRVVAEIENHPYSPYQKSHRLLALECALNILAGTHDLSLNLFSSTMPFRPGDYGYAAFLRDQRPFLDALRQAAAGKRRVGVGIEAREDVPLRMPLSGRPLTAWVEPRPWEIALSRFGIPVGKLYDAPHLLAGDVVYTDRYALGSAFQDGAVLTPRAVEGLLAQGFANTLGIREVREAPPDVNEVLTRDPRNGDSAGVCLQVRHYASLLGPHTYVFEAGADFTPLSEWVDLQGRPQGPATTALTLADGTRVGLLPFEITTVMPPLLQPARREQWAALLEWVTGEPLPVRVVEGVNVVPQLLVSRGRDEWVLALANLSADNVVARLRAPFLEMSRVVERLASGGDWILSEDALEVSVGAWSLSVLRARA